MHNDSLSLPQLAAVEPFDYVEAVAVVRELAERVCRRELSSIPAATDVRLSAGGELSVKGPKTPGSPIQRAASLLDVLLPAFDATIGVPISLRLVVASALGPDASPFPSLEAFVDALSPYAVGQPSDCLRQIVATRVRPGPSDQARVQAPAIVQAAERRDTLPPSRAKDSRPEAIAMPPARTRDASQPEEIVFVSLDADAADASDFTDEAVATSGTPGSGERTAIGEEIPSAAFPQVGRFSQRARGVRRTVKGATLTALILVGAAVAVREHRGSSARTDDTASSTHASAASMSPAAAVRNTSAPAPAATAEKKPVAMIGTAGDRDARPARMTDSESYSPAFASVGTAMFYHAEANGHTRLMRAETDGRGDVLRVTQVLDDRGRNFHARPSPDGQHIAFDSDRDGVRGIYLATADGRDVHRVSGDGYAAVPSWSPDGRQLAFIRAEPAKPKVWNLWTMDLETGGSRRLTSYAYGEPWGGSWFPDNRRIAYSHERDLVILDLKTGARRVFHSPVSGGLVRTPAVSPEGSRVIFQVHHHGSWLLDVATGKMRKVLGDPTAEEFAWAPDGHRVAYHSRGSGNWAIWVLSQ